MEGEWKTPPPPSATTRQKSPVLIGLNDCASSSLINGERRKRAFLLAENNLHTKIKAILESFRLNIGYRYMTPIIIQVQSDANYLMVVTLNLTTV